MRLALSMAAVGLLIVGCYSVDGIFDDDDDDVVFPTDDDDDDSGPAVDDDDTTEPPVDDDDTTDPPVDDDDTTEPPVDADGDGWGVDLDCDDTNPDIYPGNPAQVDGVDSDCDGLKDWLVSVYISGDDDFEWCWDTDDPLVPGDFGWPTGQLYEVWMTTGPHVVGIRGWDTGQVITAVIAHIEISDGSFWVSDAAWTFDPEPAADPDNRAGWCSVGFDDSVWQPVNVIGPIGTSPWGSAPSVFPAGSPANWIWDYYPVNLNTQYVRRQITLP